MTTARKLRWKRHEPEPRALTATDVMTAAEVAELLKLRPSTVMDYARREVLPSIQLGRHRRFIRADIEAVLMEKQTHAGAADVVQLRPRQ